MKYVYVVRVAGETVLSGEGENEISLRKNVRKAIRGLYDKASIFQFSEKRHAEKLQTVVILKQKPKSEWTTRKGGLVATTIDLDKYLD